MKKKIINIIIGIMIFIGYIWMTGKVEAATTYKNWNAINQMDIEYSYSTLFYTNDTEVNVIKGRGDQYEVNTSNNKRFYNARVGAGQEAVVQITNCAINKQGQMLDVVIKINNVNTWGVPTGSSETSYVEILCAKQEILNSQALTGTPPIDGSDQLRAIKNGDLINLTLNTRYADCNFTMTYYLTNTYNASTDTGILGGITCVNNFIYDIDVVNGSSQYSNNVFGGNEGLIPRTGNPIIYYKKDKANHNIGTVNAAVKEWGGGICAETSPLPTNVNGMWYKTSAFITTNISNSTYSFQYGGTYCGIGYNFMSPYPYQIQGISKTVNKTKVKEQEGFNYTIQQYIPNNYYGTLINLSEIYNELYSDTRYNKVEVSDQLNSNLIINGGISITNENGQNVTGFFDISTTNNLVKATVKNSVLENNADFYAHIYTINIPVYAKEGAGEGISANTIDNRANLLYSFKNKNSHTLQSNNVSTGLQYDVSTNIDHGNITSGGTVDIHTNKAIQITPSNGYYVSSITINGQEQDIRNYYGGGTINLSDIRKDYSIIVKTKAYGQIQITKRNSITLEALAGAVVGLYYDQACTSPVAGKERLTTGANGSITATQIREGTYYMKELQAPANYTLGTTVQKIMVYSGQTTQAVVQNRPNMGTVEVSKRDQNTDKIITKEDTIFALYEWSHTRNTWVTPSHANSATVNGTVADGVGARLIEKTAGTKGTYTASMYYHAQNQGKYKIVEYTRPFGYTTSNWETEIQITQDGQIFSYLTQVKNIEVKAQIDFKSNDKEVNYKNEAYGENFAQGDATIQGAVYGLYAKESILSPDDGKVLYTAGQQIATGTTNQEGKITWSDLYLGKYYIQELTPAEGYVKTTTQYEVDLKTYYNNQYFSKGNQTTQKFVYQNSIEDALYENPEKKVIGKETVIKQSFQLTKLELSEDSTMGNPLQGAGFKIYLISNLSKVKDGTIQADVNGNYKASDFKTIDFTTEETALTFNQNSDGERIPELFSNDDGIVVSPELAYGKYVVIESTTPMGVKTVDPFFITIQEDSRKPKKMIYPIDREFEARIKIVKKDDTTKRIVLKANASYRIWDVVNKKYVEQWVTYPKKVLYGTEKNPYCTTEEGYLLTPEVLAKGDYELREVAAPEGYVLSGKEETPRAAIPFSINTNIIYETDPDLGNRNAIITVEQSNSPQVGTITIEKQGEYLSHANQQEEGYQFEYTKRAVPDAKFAIYAKEDIYTQDNQVDENGVRYKIYAKDQLIKEVETNAEGKAIFEKLPLGKYYAVETKAGEGFTLNTERKEVELAYEGQDKTVIYRKLDYINERQKIKIDITKKDREEGTVLAGAEFGLFTKEAIRYTNNQGNSETILANQLMAKATSGENGMVSFEDENLPLGKYYIKELRAPKGYASSTQIIEMDCTYAGQNITKIIKESDFSNSIIKLKIKIEDYETKEGLQTTKIILRDEAGKVIEHYTVDKNGEIEVKGLEVGKRYLIEEEKQREGYVKELLFDSETADPNELVKGKDINGLVTFQIKDSEETQKVTLSNLAKVGQIEIEKTGEVLIGTEEDEKGNLIFNYERQRIDTAKFEIYTKENIVHPDGKQGIIILAGTQIGEGQTKDGILTVTKIVDERIETQPKIVQLLLQRGLPLGKYEIKETEAPKGYYYEEQTVLVDVKSQDDKNQVEKFTVTINNLRQSTNVGKPRANITVTKQAEKEVYQVGEIVKYKIIVTNTGNTLLKNISVKESMISGEFEEIEGTEKQDHNTIVIARLEIGEEKELTYYSHLTEEKLGEVDNKVTATGTPIKIVKTQDGKEVEEELEPVTDEAKEKIWNGISIRKVADKKSYKSGDKIQYTLLIMNPHDEVIENASVTDEKITSKSIISTSKEGIRVQDGLITIGTIKPREKIQIVYQYQIPENYTEGIITNTAELNGTIKEEPMIPEEDRVTVEVKKSAIEITKKAEKEIYQKGEEVNYTIKVTNIGETLLRDIVVKENLLNGQFREQTNIALEDSQTAKIAQLEIGKSIELIYRYNIGNEKNLGERIPNKVTVTGTGIIEDPENPENPKTEKVSGEAEEEIVVKEDPFIGEQQLGVYKTDFETGEPIQGAVFGIYAQEHIVNKENVVLLPKDILIEKATTNQEGFAKFKADLPIGKYYVLELEPAKGYIQNTQRLEIDSTNISSSEKEYPVNLKIQNKKTEINIEKVEKTESFVQREPIVGAVLQILEGDKVVEEWSTEKQPHNIKGLETQKEYILHEVKPAKGYVTTDDIKFSINLDGSLAIEKRYTIEETEVPTIIMQDEVTRIKITILDKETKEPIKNIIVQVVDSKTGEVVYEYTTDGEEKIIEKIPIGDYEIREKDFPKEEGYVSIDKEEMTVKDIPEVQEKIIEQDYTKLDISFIDEITKELLPGGKLEIKNGKGETIIAIDDTGVHTYQERLAVETYTIIETVVPEGYEPIGELNFTLKDIPEVQYVVIKNKRLPFDLKVEKQVSEIMINGVKVSEKHPTGEIAKIEIDGKKIAKQNVEIVYTIKVINTGKVAGNVGKVVDRIPFGLTFNPDKNEAYWKEEGGKIVATQLAERKIKPGESIELRIVLDWTKSEFNLGEKRNNATIEGLTNIPGFKDEDENNNTSSASVLLAVKTGIEIVLTKQTIAVILLELVTIGIIVMLEIALINKKNKKKKS